MKPDTFLKDILGIVSISIKAIGFEKLIKDHGWREVVAAIYASPQKA